MSILMPALAMVRKLAMRAVCGSNLAGLHKAMLTYAQENMDNYPRAGGQDSTWSYFTKAGGGNPNGWDAINEPRAFNRTTDATGSLPNNPPAGRATISASLYLLIREADVGPKSFICKAEKQTKVFSFDDFPRPPFNTRITELRMAWDFGSNAAGTENVTQRKAGAGFPVVQYYSYAYQIPYGERRDMYTWLSTGSSPELAALADRSPYLVLSPDSNRQTFGQTNDDPFATNTWGNSANHDNDGQNVLFCNGSVSFRTVPYCGMNDDNIYTMAADSVNTSIKKDPRVGHLPFMTSPTLATIRQIAPTAGSPMFYTGVKSVDLGDSVLINEGAMQGGIFPN
jgi:hypothetical protein